MTTLRSDSRTCRRVVLAFMDFLDSVQPAPGVDFEGISVVKDCLKEIFKINVPAADVEIQPGMLSDLFSSHEHAETGKSKSVMGPSPIEGMSCTTTALQNVEDSRCSKAKDLVGDPHSIEGDSKDQLMGNFFDALDKINFFKSSPMGSEDPAQIAKATELFSEAVKDMENSQGQIMNLSNLAETFKMRGNRCMQAKLYSDAIQLYTCAIALSEKNAIYYGNRAAAFTEMHRYTEAIQDCSKAIEIDPSYSKAYSRLGLAYYAQGKYKEALEKGFFKALRLDPNNESVKVNIQAAIQKLNEQGSGEEYQNATSNNGQDPSGRPTRSTSHSSFTSFPFSSSFPMEFPNVFRTTAGSGGSTTNHATSSASFTFDTTTPVDIASLFRTMASQSHQSHEGRSRDNSESSEPEIRMGADNTGSHHEQASTTPAAEPGNSRASSASTAFNVPNPAEFANLFRNMASTSPLHHARHERRPSSNPEVPGEPEVTVEASMNFDFNETPQQVSDVLRSVMGMFESQQGSQQDRPRGNG